MKDLSAKLTSKGQLVIPAELRRKHKIKAGTRVKFLDDEFGRIIVVPITEEYIERMMGCLAGGPDLLAIWEKEHRQEKDFSDKMEERSRIRRATGTRGKHAAVKTPKPVRRTSRHKDALLA